MARRKQANCRFLRIFPELAERPNTGLHEAHRLVAPAERVLVPVEEGGDGEEQLRVQRVHLLTATKPASSVGPTAVPQPAKAQSD